MQKKSEKRALFENTIAFGIGTFGAKAIMFFLLPVYTRYMTAAELGVAELIVSMVSLLLPLASLSITNALLRFALAKDSDKGQTFEISCLVTIAGVLITAIVIHFIPLDTSSLNNWRNYLCLLLFADSIRRNVSVFAKALDKINVIAVDSILYTVILFVSDLILLVEFNRGTAGYIEAILISDFASIIFQTFAGKLYRFFEFKKIDKSLLKRMVLFSLPLIIEAMSWWITNSSDRYILEYLMDEDAVGIYSVANKIPALLTTFFAVFLQAWSLSSITAYENRDDTKFYDSIWRSYCSLAFLGSALLIAVTKFLMSFLVSDAFFDAWVYAPFLIIGGVSHQLYGFFSNIYIAMKKNVTVMMIVLIAAILNVILNFALIPHMGIQGAAFSTMVTYVAMLLYYLLAIRKYMKIDLGLHSIFIGGILIAIETASVLNDKASILVSAICVIMQVILFRDTIKTLLQKIKIEISKLTKRGGC